MSEVTLGGDRLGSGQKNTIELHGYGRSTHNQGRVVRTTMSAGTLVPFLKEIGLPGTTMDIELFPEIYTHPTVGPCFGSFKAQFDIFTADFRLYNALVHNNALNIGLSMKDVKMPIMTLEAPMWAGLDNVPDIDNCQINPSCVLSHLGIRGIGINQDGAPTTRDFNAVGLLAYWDIIKCYYMNKQETNAYVVHTEPTLPADIVSVIKIDGITVAVSPSVTPIPIGNGTEIRVGLFAPGDPSSDVIIKLDTWGEMLLADIASLQSLTPTEAIYSYRYAAFGAATVQNWKYRNGYNTVTTEIKLQEFPITNIDDMRNYLLQHIGTTPINIMDSGIIPYTLLTRKEVDVYSRMYSQEGLAVKTYNSDIFNNWVKTETIDGPNGINELSAVDVSGGSLKIDALNLANKVYNLLNRIAVSGGSVNDYYEATYDVRPMTQPTTPVYRGGVSRELIFNEVVSNAQSANQPLGTLAGMGKFGGKHQSNTIRIKCTEPCYVIGIMSLTPRIDYSQGNDWDIHLKTWNDFHKPALDGIGFQDLITEQMAWWDTFYDGVNWVQKSAGKQPAWLNYMTAYNKVLGNFAIQNNEMFMCLTRRYEANETLGVVNIKDLTTYIDPSKHNYMFAQTKLDSQNFWMQVGIRLTSRRKMSAKQIPNL